jgi:2-hydroxy-3-keto-5-methylthiopentenyl-1-phosphate phosphatase
MEISAIRIDQGFHAFVSFCRGSGAEVKIVSDGFDRVVRAALGNEDLNVPFFANKLVWLGEDRWRLAFPHMRADCRVCAANCKCSHGWRPYARPRVVIGDGRSDFCMSLTADFVLAKGLRIFAEPTDVDMQRSATSTMRRCNCPRGSRVDL